MTSAPPKQTTPRSSQKLFLLIGALWLILGGVILSQLRGAVPTYIKVNWETETETETAGFNIYRVETTTENCDSVNEADYVQINDELINSTGSAVVGDTYSFVDNNIERDKTYCYELEDVELGGRTDRHEPILGAAPRQIDRILYIILAPLSLVVGLSLIWTGLKREKQL